MSVTPYGPQGDIFAQRLGMGGAALIMIGIVAAVAGIAAAKRWGVPPILVKGSALLGLGVVLVVSPLLLVGADSPTEQFYEVKTTPVKAIGPVVKTNDSLLSSGDVSAREVVYEDQGHQYKQLVWTDQIKLSDHGDPKKSLKGVRRGTINAKLVLKPRYRPYAKQIEHEFKPHRDMLVNIDETTVHLERPTNFYRLDQLNGKD